MRAISYFFFFCYRNQGGSTKSLLQEEDRAVRVCSGHCHGPRRAIGCSRPVGRMPWQPALSVISEDAVLQTPVSDHRLMKKSSTLNKDKAMAKSRGVNTRNLYSWRYLLENSSSIESPSPFML
ncbi:hypothetical protein MLD38_025816 [Melastoma candidum]|uniref:Uncharacterized protein n=1 Tax=Melastoma candidum TaxID=119954 RepID=A0ACB9NXY6_9MYRT|nr:hypothetical protein MLD38_025816 [Melastoma candidum]